MCAGKDSRNIYDTAVQFENVQQTCVSIPADFLRSTDDVKGALSKPAGEARLSLLTNPSPPHPS